MFYFVGLNKSETTPGQYEIGQLQDGVDGYTNSDELIHDNTSDGSVVYELGVDTLLPGMEDIRDHIVGDPVRVFASQMGVGEEIDYCCIIDIPETAFQHLTLEESEVYPGKYEIGSGHEELYASSADFKKEYVDDGLGGVMYELGVDALPAGVTDIRGRIIGNPARVFAYLLAEDHDAGYSCIIQLTPPAAQEAVAR